MSPLGGTFDIPLKLMRRYRLKRTPDFVLANEVVPVVLMDDLVDFQAQGDAARESWGTLHQGAVVAENAFCVLVNSLPRRLVIKDLWISSETSQQILVRRPTAVISGLTPGTNKAFADFRTPGQPQAVLGQDTAVAAPAGRIVWRGTILADTPLHIPCNFTLFGGPAGDEGPGGAGSRTLAVIADTANTDLKVVFKWFEGQGED